jgi:2-iminobutanoate/2-iminopropanoate deaminase
MTNSPKPQGPYSPAVVANGFVFVSGQIAVNPETGKLVESDITVQTKQVMENLKMVLKTKGVSIKDVVKTGVFLKNPEELPAMNSVYETYFTDNKPARTIVPGVEWKPGVLIEIDAIATI